MITMARTDDAVLVVIGSANKVKVEAVRQAFAESFPGAKIEFKRVCTSTVDERRCCTELVRSRASRVDLHETAHLPCVRSPVRPNCCRRERRVRRPTPAMGHPRDSSRCVPLLCFTRRADDWSYSVSGLCRRFRHLP